MVMLLEWVGESETEIESRLTGPFIYLIELFTKTLPLFTSLPSGTGSRKTEENNYLPKERLLTD